MMHTRLCPVLLSVSIFHSNCPKMRDSFSFFLLCLFVMRLLSVFVFRLLFFFLLFFPSSQNLCIIEMMARAAKDLLNEAMSKQLQWTTGCLSAPSILTAAAVRFLPPRFPILHHHRSLLLLHHLRLAFHHRHHHPLHRLLNAFFIF